MKRLFVILIGLYMAWFCQCCFASPFLVSDPRPEAIGGQFEITEGGTRVCLNDNQPDGSIRFDLKDVTIGTHSYQIRYAKSDPLWGTVYSTWVPFQFERPNLATGNIEGLKLVP